MKVDFRILELRTKYAFNISRAPAPPVRRSGWVVVRDEDGLEGWGEAPVTSLYYGETADTAAAVMPLLSAAVEAAMEGDPFALERADAAARLAIGANPGAKAGLSAALHDLAGKRLGTPVWRMFGLTPIAPRSSFTIGLDEIEPMRDRVREAEPYEILKIKLGTKRDEEILSMVRSEAPTKTIRVDANTGWSPRQAIAALPMLEEFGVELLEQPVHPDDIAGLASITRVSRIPVIADESCRTAADIPRLAGVVDAINIKLAKCGSLREALRMVHCARAHQMGVMLGCMVESSLGISAAVQLAPLVDYVDLDGAALLDNDPFSGPGLDTDGSLLFNQTPGLGITTTSAD